MSEVPSHRQLEETETLSSSLVSRIYISKYFQCRRYSGTVKFSASRSAMGFWPYRGTIKIMIGGDGHRCCRYVAAHVQRHSSLSSVPSQRSTSFDCSSTLAAGMDAAMDACAAALQAFSCPGPNCPGGGKRQVVWPAGNGTGEWPERESETGWILCSRR